MIAPGSLAGNPGEKLDAVAKAGFEGIEFVEQDLIADALDWGRRFRVLASVDDVTRAALALVVDTSLSGGRVARELDALIAGRGRPATIVSHTETDLTSRAILDWAVSAVSAA